MKIRVLGCHGSDQVLRDGGQFRSCCTCGFLVDDVLLLDAGTVGRKLDLDEQRRIRTVLLTHAHFDHIQGLPTLADNLAGSNAAAVELIAPADTLSALQTHIFNDRIYPNFFRLPTTEYPVFRGAAVSSGQRVERDGLAVRAVPVTHTVPAVGYLLSDATATLLYSGDTYDTDELWQVAAATPTLKAVFVETSYPDSMSGLAQTSRHLTPSLLGQQLRKLGRAEVPVYLYHVKPRFREEIRREVAALRVPHRIAFLEEDQILHLS